MKSSESLTSKGFFAVCSPFGVIRFHTLLPLAATPDKGKSKGKKILQNIITKCGNGKPVTYERNILKRRISKRKCSSGDKANCHAAGYHGAANQMA